MSTDLRQVRSEKHVQIGELLQRDVGIIIERWARRAVEEQPNAKRLHHEALLDHLPTFIRQMGRSLAASDPEGNDWHTPLAAEHGEQRWEAGWSLVELVRDYQILRLVIVEYLEQTLERPLTGREVMAVGLALDDAIAASVSAHATFQADAARRAEREQAECEKAQEQARHRAQAEELQEQGRRKDEFLALLGHELRNPLAPLHNALHILHLRGADPPTVAWAQEVAQRQVQQLTRLVDDLLDVSRIGRGKILLRRERVDLTRLVGTVVEDHRRALEAAGLSLTLQLPPAPVWVLGDPVRLAQVVGNLFHNAIKFTDPGGRVTVSLAAPDGGRQVQLTIRDTGIGIEPAVLPHLFGLYTQAERSLQRSRGGLGLGLALVKGLTELHGGSVRAGSAGPGQGSEFSLCLPAAADEAAPREVLPTADPAGAPLRILVIEDNRDAAEVLRVLLELARHQVVVAHTGPSGIEAARQFRPDVILCDLGLPGMDGLAVARQLRADPTTATARLVALTGYGSRDDQQRAREAGFDRHLTKPVEPEDLQRALAADPPASPSCDPQPPGTATPGGS
jgi:signal transduction histidine kinase/ActR/RegA family two-component response regulator